jgi:hypothetical protein
MRRYAALPRARKRLLREALLSLALARAAMLLLPFRRVAAWLGTPGIESAVSPTPEQIRVAQEIGWAVAGVARRVPWDGRCLAQALAATHMLRRRGLEGTVTFGAGRGGGVGGDGSAEFSAHAWLRLGPFVVTGGPGSERFKTLTTFARRPQ